MPSSDDDFCTIVERNNPHDRDEDLENVLDESLGSSDGGQELNPFASFAFGGSTAPAVVVRPSGGAKRKRFDTAPKTPTASSAGRKTPKKGGCKADGIGELSTEELGALRARWRGMADREAGVEDQRFQVLVGAILSSRAQASVVDEGMSRLRARDGGLTAAALADTEQEELAGILRHVHWNKAKAKHVRESAAMILRRHRGIVPRRRRDLLALPGVGPALVEILLNVFDNWGNGEDSSPQSTRTADGGDGGGDGVGDVGGRRGVDGGSGGVGGGREKGNGGEVGLLFGDRRKTREEGVETNGDESRDVDLSTGGEVDLDGGVGITEAVASASPPESESRPKDM